MMHVESLPKKKKKKSIQRSIRRHGLNGNEENISEINVPRYPC